MAPAPNSDENDNNGRRSNDNSDKTNRNSTDPSSSSSSSSSWFGSWFERGDMRDEIHEQLNQFDERKKRYEEELEERRRAWQSSFPFPFFGSPPDRTNGSGNNNGNHKHNNDRWEEFFGGSPGPGHPFGREGFEDFSGHHWNQHHQRHHRNNDDDDEYERNIHEIHREMQNLFETAFAGSGMMPPPVGIGEGKSAGNRIPFGSLSSSSTTVVSSSNGTSYRMQRDSRSGARIDVQLPRDRSRDKTPDRRLDGENAGVALEVLRERPCVIRWREPEPQPRSSDRGAGGGDNHHRDDRDWRRKPLQRPWEQQQQHQQRNQQVLELGDSVDCSKLSASISEASNILTVEAPIRRRDDAVGEESPASRLSRAVPVSRTD